MNLRFIILLLSLLLISCEPSDDLMDSYSAAKAAEAEILAEYGQSVRISMVRTNGRLSDVSVAVAHKRLGDLSVEDFLELVEPILTKHLGELPELITVSVIFVNES